MANPFPGMNPHLEVSGDWRDLHAPRRDALVGLLPDRSIARIDERFRAVEIPGGRGRSAYPDVSVARTGPGYARDEPGGGVATIDLEPVVAPLPTIPIPLDAPDPDVPLDLAPAFALTYRRGRYGRILRYGERFPMPVDEAGRAWIEGQARAGRGVGQGD